jgi:predicted MFS family arabinose efflux permease
MLTPVVFAFMMSQVDRRIGATHYTLLATVEVLGKAPGAWLSGLLADALGFRTVFAMGAGLSALFLLMLLPVRQLPGLSRGR